MANSFLSNFVKNVITPLCKSIKLRTIAATILPIIVKGIATAKSDEKKSRTAAQAAKKEKIRPACLELQSILPLYPVQTPCDIMRTANINDPPWFGNADDVSVRQSLAFQIDDYKRWLTKKDLIAYHDEAKNEIKKREWAKNEIQKNVDAYREAQKKYAKFTRKHGAAIELYGSQELKNAIVRWENVIYNMYIAGNLCAKTQTDAGTCTHNAIDDARNTLTATLIAEVG